MKQKIVIKGDDGKMLVTITATIATSSIQLTADEQRNVKKELTRELARVLTNVPYADFGIENTTLK